MDEDRIVDMERRWEREEDIQKRANEITWLVSYPRSGVTWMRFLLLAILYPDEEIGHAAANRFLPDIHQPLYWKRWEVHKPLFIKSHFVYHQYYEKVIYIYRDGRDVALSLYHFLDHEEHTPENRTTGITIDHFLAERFLQGEVAFGRWSDHVKFWLDHEYGINFLPVKYEELWQNPCAVMERVLSFIGGPVIYPIDIQTGVDAVVFEKRRDMGQREGEHPNLLGLRGRPGGWRENLTRKQKDLIWQKFGKFMERIGYKDD